MKITNKRRFPVTESLAVLIVMLVMGIFYLNSRSAGQAGNSGDKTLQVEIVYENLEKDEYTVTTEGQYLKDALDEIPGLSLEGVSTEEFGLMVITVNGVRADYQKDNAYWAVLLDGEPCSYGVSRQLIADGEHYSLVYTPAQ